MRELKFRVWDGLLMHHVNYDSNEKIFQRYIGLKDKYGKEIYEGDIVRCEQANGFEKVLKAKIGYAAPCGRRYWGLFFTDSDDIHSFDLNPFESSCNFIVEVIGNIYENPELLK